MSSTEPTHEPAALARRWACYAIGLFLVAFAVSLSVKSNLGVSPATSIAYVASVIQGWSMGAWTALVYSAFVLLQAALRGKTFQARTLLQVPVSMAFGTVVDATNWMVSLMPAADTYALQLGYLAASLAVMGVGYVFYLPPNIMSLPSEGVMQSISYRFGLKNSTAKIIWDSLCVAVTCTLSFAFLGGLVGIREGTVIAAFGNGLSMKLMSRILKPRLVDPLLGAGRSTLD